MLLCCLELLRALMEQEARVLRARLRRAVHDDREDEVQQAHVDGDQHGQKQDDRPWMRLNNRQGHQAPAVTGNDLLREREDCRRHGGERSLATVTTIVVAGLGDFLVVIVEQLHRDEGPNAEHGAQQHRAPDDRAHGTDEPMQQDVQLPECLHRPHRLQEAEKASDLHDAKRRHRRDVAPNVADQFDQKVRHDDENVQQPPPVPENSSAQHERSAGHVGGVDAEEGQVERVDPHRHSLPA
mmetsp:Transcript_31243/g.85790  ORF Transcript_31243/g.85790 Transcript_31243/m.85790 type:complete len:240 (-) Transcript_31243:392-1111(-)